MMPDRNRNSSLEQVLEHVEREIREGLGHGFFDFSVSCEIGNGKRRQVTIKAGRSHRFTIPEEEIE